MAEKFAWDWEYPTVTIKNGRIREVDGKKVYDDYLAGKLKGGFMRYSIESDYIEMVQLFISESDRLKGYGRKLMKFLEKKGKMIRIHTGSVLDDPFGKFLLKLGYEYIQGEHLNWKKEI